MHTKDRRVLARWHRGDLEAAPWVAMNAEPT
jgi:hypothetical protein